MGLLESLLEKLRSGRGSTPREDEASRGHTPPAGAGPYRRPHEAEEDRPLQLGSLPRFAGYEVVATLDAEGDHYARYQLQPREASLPCCAVAIFLVDPPDDEGWFSIRFDETRLALRLAHPNIARVLEMESLGRLFWYLSEYPLGETLETILAAVRYGAERPSLDVIASVFADFARGLHAAHTDTDEEGHPLGWVYRTLRPSSLLVTMEGTGKVADWGLTDLISVHHARDSDPRGALAARSPAAMQYMSPEQARGAPVDSRADVFTLGAIAHEVCTGIPLFAGKHFFETLGRVTGEPAPPLAERVPGCPPELSYVVARALAKDPSARPPAGEIADALSAGLAARGVQDPPALVARYLRSIQDARPT